MTFANVGVLETAPGRRDEVVAVLTRHNPELGAAGCLSYEVGVDDAAPDTVFVTELWESEDAHRASLRLPGVRAAIVEARPLLAGMDGRRFTVVGSPLRD
ncbi:putative quinol monooxygenase [Streptomyces sp. NPDC000931]|uniref:Antibiotic biosynthesis monooxygenase n=1 Tax=Nocardiopsis eucommiae TaxID=2831970 RepID=A0A975QK16_9ACTN|nr:antibiotic biosynthesis monooxygenase [Nocardiopsis eucommiae]